ncbi:potassium transporter [bacterium]|nr:potassium transporter [bacterium]
MKPALRLVVGLALLVLAGTLLLRVPACGRNQALTWAQAFFTAVSALATTGLSVITPGKDLSLTGQWVLLLLMQVGGVGYMVLSVVVFLLLGRDVTFQDRVTLRDSLGLISTSSLLHLVRLVVAGVVLIEVTGGLALWLLWGPAMGWKQAAYLGLWHSVSAFCNASFDLFSGSPDAPAGFPQDAGTLLVLSSMVALGSIGIPVLSELVRWRPGKRLSLHTRLTLITVGVLLLGGTVLLFVGFSQTGDLFADQPWPRRLLMAWFHSSTARTSGFVLEDLSHMHAGNVLVLSCLMFVGGSPASMGGGITTSTVAVLLLAVQAQVRGRGRVRAGARELATETVTKASAIFVLALVFCGVVSWLLLITQPATLPEAIFETVSAFSTCGFTLGLTTRLDLFGQFLVAATMFCGRLGVLTVVVAMTRTSTSLVRYPEEKILIG